MWVARHSKSQAVVWGETEEAVWQALIAVQREFHGVVATREDLAEDGWIVTPEGKIEDAH